MQNVLIKHNSLDLTGFSNNERENLLLKLKKNKISYKFFNKKIKIYNYQLLNEIEIRKNVLLKLQDFLKFTLFYQTSSTNDYVLNNYQAGLVCLAETQTKGRGRNNKIWLSKPVENIYLSFGYSFNLSKTNLKTLSLTVGVIIADFLSSKFNIDIKLKWPNDLIINKKKLCGILIETMIENDCIATCIGIGLNFKTAILKNSTCFLDCITNQITRNELIGKLLNSLCLGMIAFNKYGFEFFKNSFNQRNLLKTCNFQILLDGKYKQAQYLGLADNGNIIIQVNENILNLSSEQTSIVFS